MLAAKSGWLKTTLSPSTVRRPAPTASSSPRAPSVANDRRAIVGSAIAAVARSTSLARSETPDRRERTTSASVCGSFS
jgi:hypothetical protein